MVNKLKKHIAEYFVGNEEIIENVMICLFAGGHILIEGVPGVGKTTLASTIAKSVDCDFGRIQFTPDTLPTDVMGSEIFNMKTGEFEYREGAIMHQIVLADEINRTSAKTQSSLLEAMAEGQTTVCGVKHRLPEPFMVIATQNPTEFMGTYQLPEAQLDRFIIKIDMGETTKKDELEIIDRYVLDNPIDNIEPVCTTQDIVCLQEEIKKIMVSDVVRQYIVDVVFETRQSNKLLVGASTRATLALLKMSQAYAAIKGKKYVEPDHVKSVAPYVLGHRVKVVNAMNSGSSKKIVEEIIGACPVPVEDWEK